MDVTALPGLGIAGALVIAIGYLLVADHRDHTAHQRAMQQRDSEHAAELAAGAAYDADLAGLSSRVSPLERRLGEWEAELDRDRRCAAEDDAPAARRTRYVALGMIEDWRPAVRDLVSGASPSSLYPLLFWVAPEIEQWQTVPSVTVLGDAVHVMPPTGGIGASTALCDAAALADVLELVDQGLAEPAHALRVYEAEMLERGQDAISTSVSNLRWAQRLDGPVAFRLGKFGLKTVGETQNALRSLAERIGLRDSS